MTALLIIHFEDGSTREIPLGDKCIQINLPPESRQSIAVKQKPSGEFQMSFTAPLMEGKKFSKIVIEKRP